MKKTMLALMSLVLLSSCKYGTIGSFIKYANVTISNNGTKKQEGCVNAQISKWNNGLRKLKKEQRLEVFNLAKDKISTIELNNDVQTKLTKGTQVYLSLVRFYSSHHDRVSFPREIARKMIANSKSSEGTPSQSKINLKDGKMTFHMQYERATQEVVILATESDVEFRYINTLEDALKSPWVYRRGSNFYADNDCSVFTFEQLLSLIKE